MAPIANSGASRFDGPACGGAQSKTFHARYYSNGIAGTGGVTGVATFTMTYS